MKLIIDIDEEEYNRIKHFCSFGDNIPLGWYEIANGKPLQEELEEIKAEADRQGYYNKHDRIMVEQILDNHINKADCDNDCEHCTWTECPKE